MYTILMDALCLDCHSELLLSEETDNEAVIESVIALILHDFFGDIAIEGVKMIDVPATHGQSSQHLLQVHASSSNEIIALPIALLEARLEEVICCALLEHFHTVVINAIDVHQEGDDAPTTTNA